MGFRISLPFHLAFRGENGMFRTGAGQTPPRAQPALPALRRRQLSLLTELATELTTQDTGLRLADLILRHLDRDPPEDEVHLGSDLTPTELAGLVGTVRAVASRQLRNLERASDLAAEHVRRVVEELDRLVALSDRHAAVKPPNTG